MDVSHFFTRLLQPSIDAEQSSQPDDLGEFDAAWQAIQAGHALPRTASLLTCRLQETLEHPDERQLVRYVFYLLC